MGLSIVLYGDPILRRKAPLIERITPEIETLASQMIKKMIESDGVGLAAPQVGHSIRLFVIQDELTNAAGEFSFGPPEVIVNPVFSNPSQEKEMSAEGCLSLPKILVDVERPLKIHVRYQNLKGEFIEEDLQGFRARLFMHENDHLNGVLMIDRISSRERNRLDPFLRKIASARPPAKKSTFSHAS